jgi:hypothetical protein
MNLVDQVGVVLQGVPRHLYQIAVRKLTNDADGTFVLHVVAGELRGHHVLDDFVFHHT